MTDDDKAVGPALAQGPNRSAASGDLTKQTMKQEGHREDGEPAECTEGGIGIWNQSEFRFGDLIQAFCELTDPNSMRRVTEDTEESRRAQSISLNPEPVPPPSP